LFEAANSNLNGIQMTQPFAITADQFLILCGINTIGIVLAWGVVFYSLRSDKQLAEALFADGLSLKILTVVFIVCAVFDLALVGKLTGEISTIFSGIVGYVLGSTKFAHPRMPRSKDDQLGKDEVQ